MRGTRGRPRRPRLASRSEFVRAARHRRGGRSISAPWCRAARRPVGKKARQRGNSLHKSRRYCPLTPSGRASLAERSARLAPVSGLSNPELIRLLALDLLVMVLSQTVHECAHAWVAQRLGDDTAEREGRISLSPVTHVDPLGTLLIPAMSVLLGGGFGFIGWARPVPVSPERFRRTVHMRSGMALVAAAGPLSNLVLALIA